MTVFVIMVVMVIAIVVVMKHNKKTKAIANWKNSSAYRIAVEIKEELEKEGYNVCDLYLSYVTPFMIFGSFRIRNAENDFDLGKILVCTNFEDWRSLIAIDTLQVPFTIGNFNGNAPILVSNREALGILPWMEKGVEVIGRHGIRVDLLDIK
jgi:hypothetical protein